MAATRTSDPYYKQCSGHWTCSTRAQEHPAYWDSGDRHVFLPFWNQEKTHRTPVTEPPVPEQAGFSPANLALPRCWRWLWNGENHRHSPPRSLGWTVVTRQWTIGDCLRRFTTWQGTTNPWCAWYTLHWRTFVSSWNSEGKEVDGDHRGTACRRRVSSHHFSSTYTQTTSLFTRALAALCMLTTLPSLQRAQTLHQSRKHWPRL